jgi:hypothetical protein
MWAMIQKFLMFFMQQIYEQNKYPSYALWKFPTHRSLNQYGVVLFCLKACLQIKAGATLRPIKHTVRAFICIEVDVPSGAYLAGFSRKSTQRGCQ